MFQKQKYIVLVLAICCCQYAFSQITKTEKDTFTVKKNSETHTKTKKHTPFLQGLNIKSNNSTIFKRQQQKYLDFDGKIIRNINIITLDPFGHSDTDSLVKPENWGEKTGNKLHNKTNNRVVENLLLFKKNKPFDSLFVKESERLIRSQNYVSKITISGELTTIKSDSVDIYIHVLDSWSTVPKISIFSSDNSIGVNELNLLGFGHRFDVEYITGLEDGKTEFNSLYVIPSFKNSYVETTLNYNIDSDNYYRKSINIERVFYSPLAKWAGGIYFDKKHRKDSLPDANLVYANQNFKYNTQDYWIGRAFRIFKGNSVNERTTNLILSARFLNIKYLDSPTIVYDPVHFYTGENFFLSGIGISSRKFIKDKHIFKNGITEDVPIGKIYGITGGYQYKNNLGQFYLGCQASYGKYYTWGFLSTNFELGTFFYKSITKQTAYSIQANYFTKLVDIGKWKLRQFIKPEIIIGINRENSVGDWLTINEDNGISGFNSAYYGTKKIVLTLQTQTYSSWDFLGFRLNPYFNYSVGRLGTPERGLLDSKSYSKIGIGFNINNDYFVFRSFQISLSYYPSIPGIGENIFKTNAFVTSDFGFQDFELNKPRTIIYE